MPTPLKDRVQAALDESRILVLGAVVLLGFEYRAVFEPRFEEMPDWAKLSKLVSLCVILVAFCLIVLPAAYHRIVAAGEDSEDVNRFTSRVLEIALAFFAAAIGLDSCFAARSVLGTAGSLAAGAGAALVSAALWYGYTFGARVRHARHPQRNDMERTEITEKVKHVLTEARMVLPGAQALLGFQFSVTLMESFDELPRALKLAHLVGLGFIGLSVVLLMTPAAYHRIVERGEATEHFHRVASRLVLAAMVPLTFGICTDLLIVADRITESLLVGAITAGAAAVFVLGTWFGLTAVLRRVRPSASPAA